MTASAFQKPVPSVRCPCCGKDIEGLQRRARGHVWTAAQDRFVLTASERGATRKLIAAALGTSADVVGNRLLQLRAK